MINSIENIINDGLNKYYKKSKKLTIRNRYKGLSKTYNEILKLVNDNYKKEAEKYYVKRSKQDKKLSAIQNKAFKEIKNCIEKMDCFKNNNIKFEIIPASSFSAKMNLIGESDIDFGILLKKFDMDSVICLSNSLGSCNYKLTEIRNKNNTNKIHWVFQKYINGVEIEGKVRDYKGFKEFLKMHKYLDNKMKRNEKVLATYTKYLLSKTNKKLYSDFKQIYYCNAGYHGGSKELLYSLR